MQPPRVSAQVAFLVTSAIAIGLVDAALVVIGLAGARGAVEFVPATMWIAAPLTWLMVAAAAALILLPFTRRWFGPGAALDCGLLFVAIRLRSYPAVLTGSIAMIVAVSSLTWPMLRAWLSRPRRLASGVGGAAVIVAAVLISGAPMEGVPFEGASRSTDPNVVVIFLDTVRYDAVFGTDGQVHRDLKTLARLRGESTSFTRAFATSSWTLPSHLSAVTGLAPHELGVSFDSQRYDGSAPTLAERFQRRGYRTAAVISNSFLNPASGVARGFDTFQHARRALDLCRTAPGVVVERLSTWFAASVCNWTAGEVTARALPLMTDAERPFFLMLNYMDAHDPYYVEPLCGGGNGYRAALACLDRQLAPVIDWRSSHRPTILAVLSDHGELFGEHGLERHGNGLFTQLLHVPMMIRSSVPNGERTVTDTISIAGLPALLGLDEPPRNAPALALLHPPAAEHASSQWSATDGVWHLIVPERGGQALYHLPTDPAETNNLGAAPRDPRIDRLREAIAAMREQPKPELKRFRSLGYIH